MIGKTVPWFYGKGRKHGDNRAPNLKNELGYVSGEAR